MILSLRAGAKAYINGAVIRTDRRVNLQILNDVTFLLDSHVMQVEEATTPLRQIYFAVQAALMDPSEADSAAALAAGMLLRLAPLVETPDIARELPQIAAQLEAGRHFDVMKRLRALFPVEDAILAAQPPRAASRENRA
ncbi:MAG: flagellar biosynthesis repressor FlbT [Rhizobiales bacterium]|nr:flagellar biosynthesis repressor FlbT [Hyphomicrobiales bacterium]